MPHKSDSDSINNYASDTVGKSAICLHFMSELFVYNLLLLTADQFDEDGSFIGQYGTLQRKQQEHLLQQQMQLQELGIKPGGTYL